MQRMNVAVIFGSKSVEHDISVITAHQVMEALDRARYKPIPIYITKKGKWLHRARFIGIEPFRMAISLLFLGGRRSVQLNERLAVRKLFGLVNSRIDVAIPATHGTFGEDGTVQAYLELLNVPYVGCGILSSSLCMHKGMTKRVLRESGLPVVDFLEINRNTYNAKRGDVLAAIQERFSYPVFVKPAVLGSSIGIARVSTAEELEDGIDVAFTYCDEVVVEPAVREALELNCAVLGNGQFETSAIERPLTGGDVFLNFDAKYIRKGKAVAKGTVAGMDKMAREVPAKIPESMADQVRGLAIKAFVACKCKGMARIDFLVDGHSKDVYINEINTLPGSFAYYLWEPVGFSFPELLNRLIQLSLEQHRDKSKTIFTLEENLLAKGQLGAK